MNKIIIKNKTINSIIFVISFSMIIRLLSLLNRIILNRMLGADGVALYTISIPSIMLFVSLGSISLNTSINQIVAQNKDSFDKKLLKEALSIAIIAASVSSLLLLVILKPLSYNWLKTKDAFFPILSAIPLIYLSSINSVLRGIYNGLSKVKLSQLSIFIEQIFRILFQILLLLVSTIITKSVTYAILSMSLGEIASIIYLITKLRKTNKHKTNNIYAKDILHLSMPLTLTHLSSSLSSFLEPIIFTFIFTKLSYSSDIIRSSYSEISAYILPTIAMFLFISASISPILIQKVIYYNTNNKKELLMKMIEKIIFIILLSSILILTILYFYIEDLIYILYDYKIEENLIKKYIFLFIFVYIESPLIAIMQGLQENKKIFKIITISSTLKLLLILIIPYMFSIGPKDTIIISYLSSYTLVSCIIYVNIRKKLGFKFPLKYLVYLIIFTFFIFSLLTFLNLLFLK